MEPGLLRRPRCRSAAGPQPRAQAITMGWCCPTTHHPDRPPAPRSSTPPASSRHRSRPPRDRPRTRQATERRAGGRGQQRGGHQRGPDPQHSRRDPRTHARRWSPAEPGAGGGGPPPDDGGAGRSAARPPGAKAGTSAPGGGGEPPGHPRSSHPRPPAGRAASEPPGPLGRGARGKGPGLPGPAAYHKLLGGTAPLWGGGAQRAGQRRGRAACGGAPTRTRRPRRKGAESRPRPDDGQRRPGARQHRQVAAGPLGCGGWVDGWAWTREQAQAGRGWLLRCGSGAVVDLRCCHRGREGRFCPSRCCCAVRTSARA